MANEKISDLATAVTVVGTDSTVIVSSGVNKQTLFSTILAYIQTVTGWNLTGTTTLTGASTIDIDGNTLEFSGGEVGIGGAAVGGVALNVVGNLTTLGPTTNRSGIMTNDINAQTFIGDWQGNGNETTVKCDDIEKTVTIFAIDGIRVSGSVTAYANNAAAVAAIGTGKLYYTDVAGEYMVKLSH